MTRKYALNRCLQFGLASFLSCGTVSILTVKALAQQSNIVPDNTLGSESSQVIGNFQGQSIERITGGATRGINLFHSFKEFNISTDRAAYFFNSNSAIENILARVTGGNPSEILGKLGTSGSSNVNLFLMNPNGIVFGKDASLDVQGSFVGTTANGLAFGNQGVFSATTPTAPGLLTINPSALFFNQINQNAAIQNNSVAPAGTSPVGFNALGLRVQDGRSLLLVGGNVSMDGGQLNAYGGRIELSGLASTGNVFLLFDENNLRLGFPDNVTRGTVTLTNSSVVFVTGAGGGDITINARNIEITGGSILSGGIGQGLGTSETVAGDITLNATGEIDVADSGSQIRNLVRKDSKGNGGNITINAGSFKLRDNAFLSASTSGKGDAGNVKVTALDAVSADNVSILSTVEAGGQGKGGNIDITARTLSLTNGAQLVTITRGASNTQPAGIGDAGNVNVKVTGAVDIAGVKNGFTSGIFSRVETGTEGKGGNITIDAGSFKLRDSAFLSASTYGKGDAGNVKVTALDAVSLADNAYIFSTVEAGGNGKGGNIDITARTLSLTDGAQLQTITSGASNTQPGERGDAGNVNVKVTGAVDIAGVKNGLSSAILSFVETGTEGKGGNITIDADSFKLRDGALLDARTKNNNIGGNITVNANVFETLNGGQLTTTTSSNGSAGKITVNAKDKVIISGSDPNYNLRVTNFPNRIGNIGANSGLFVSSTGSGITGDIEVKSPKITLDNQGKLNAESASGNGGNITLLNTDLLLLRHGSQISTTAGTAASGGNGGTINIDSKYIIAVPKENSDISANAYSGNGGKVDIVSKGIFGIEARPKPTEKSDITASSSQGGISGVININAPDTSTIQNGLLKLSTYAIDTNSLIANSCISRGTKRQENSFTITGSGALPTNRPSDVFVSNYTTGEVRGVETTSRPWKKGDPIIEPQGVYQLNNGQLLLSRECSN
jgi:filamentous hemagglutinin family protein